MKQNSAHTILSHDPTTLQRTASDPLVSAWVNASAGSGKTKVLTDRILRLLLPREDGNSGTPPEKILALTFTKAGANEMALRLSKRLSEWAVMDERTLVTDIERNLLGRPPTNAEQLCARRLFAQIVDIPGGLKIMTIHSFCQSILGRFPIEAALPPHFHPLEEGESRDLLAKARKQVLATAQALPASPLAQAVEHLARMWNEEQLTSLLSLMNAERRQIQSLLAETFTIDGLYARLCALLDIRPGLTDEQAVHEFCEERHSEADIRRLCALLASGKNKTDRNNALFLQNYWDSAPHERLQCLSAYRGVFLKADGEPYARPVAKAFLDMPDIADLIARETRRLITLDRARRAIACAALTRDTFLFGTQVLDCYQSLKYEQGALDFDDLIIRTLSLLKSETFYVDGQETASPWVLYKLDEGLDHILIDEAQDTNPEQWEIIQLLTDEFFSGQGARNETNRTLFVVGDEKQSIFSFQRAAPDKFIRMRDWFALKIRQAGQTFLPVDMNTSFRSVDIILDAVDTVFGRQDNGLQLTERYLSHVAHRQGQAGLVELWPLMKDRTTGHSENAEQGWLLPDTIVESQSGSLQMANFIGDRIKNWLETEEILESHGRPIQPGDILILVATRKALVSQLVRALKTRNIPVSGVDRMILNDQLVVQDLCSAAAFALLPEDDLALAQLLKSPFIGYDDDRLYALAQPRTGTLWQALQESKDTVALDWLKILVRQAGTLMPYDFFNRLVNEPCPADSISGLRAIKRRLGGDALDPLDEFLNLALDFGSGHKAAGLQSYLRWHEEGKSEIKREMEEGGNAVRIMTVHGAKGLQAPIVILPDTVRNVSSLRPERIFWPEKTGLSAPLVNPGREDAVPLCLTAAQTIQNEQDREYRRLLYVAMTRAEERLYIGGYIGKRGPSDGKIAYWYNDVRSALESRDDLEHVPSGILDDSGQDQPILRLQTARTAPPDKSRRIKAIETTAAVPSVPSYFYQKAPAEPTPPRPLVPSRPSEPDPPAASPLVISDLYRFRRGTITHRLLQTLPDLPTGQRRIAAEKFVARAAFGLSADIQTGIVKETLAILEESNFASIFGPGSMAELPVTGYLEDGTLISGQIDRILVTDKEILIVDFKTNRPPPTHPEDVHPVYLRQMRAYARAIGQIYPRRNIRCALLWTDGPRLMEITV